MARLGRGQPTNVIVVHGAPTAAAAGWTGNAFNTIVDLSFQFSPTTAATATPVWVELTGKLMRASTKIGRNTELDTYQAGTLRATLDDFERALDPVNAAGPYAGNLKPRRSVRMQARVGGVIYPVWRGFIDGYPADYQIPLGGRTIVTIPGADGLKILAKVRLPAGGSIVGTNDTTSQRVGRILDYAGWPAGDRNLDPDTQTQLQALTLSAQTAVSELTTTAAVENNLLHIDQSGRVTLRARTWAQRHATTSTLTFGDGGGAEIPYRDLTPGYDDRFIVNRATAQRTGGTLQDFSDSASVTEFFETSKSLGTMPCLTDFTPLNVAQWVVFQQAQPAWRVQAIELNTGLDATVAAAVLGLNIGTRVTVLRRPNGQGSPISEDVSVEGIEHNLDAAKGSWKTTLYLTPADTVTWWSVGTSLWDTQTRWG